jgi:acyl-CoA-binding protein|tara:strand:- start:849 stop:1016 length:168 start_codon:yes stop_codon:yes gene_type:complete
MWAETGGMDFTGREKWKAWMALRGADVHQAKEAFCQSYGRAMAPERKEINFRKYG